MELEPLPEGLDCEVLWTGQAMAEGKGKVRGKGFYERIRGKRGKRINRGLVVALP